MAVTTRKQRNLKAKALKNTHDVSEDAVQNKRSSKRRARARKPTKAKSKKKAPSKTPKKKAPSKTPKKKAQIKTKKRKTSRKRKTTKTKTKKMNGEESTVRKPKASKTKSAASKGKTSTKKKSNSAVKTEKRRTKKTVAIKSKRVPTESEKGLRLLQLLKFYSEGQYLTPAQKSQLMNDPLTSSIIESQNKIQKKHELTESEEESEGSDENGDYGEEEIESASEFEDDEEVKASNFAFISSRKPKKYSFETNTDEEDDEEQSNEEDPLTSDEENHSVFCLDSDEDGVGPFEPTYNDEGQTMQCCGIVSPNDSPRRCKIKSSFTSKSLELCVLPLMLGFDACSNHLHTFPEQLKEFLEESGLPKVEVKKWKDSYARTNLYKKLKRRTKRKRKSKHKSRKRSRKD